MHYGKTARVSGVLTNLDGNDRDVRQYDVHLVHATQLNEALFQLIGGPTGFESFIKNELNVQNLCARGWLANGGTQAKWDRLFIPGEEMRKAFVEFGVL